ncbi:glycosyl hydrolase family 18 protein [Clostridiaceae bacterium M8S5]|nr:glycosyl hydrolase family 18 protein [Clostridiaceae bacterium M8S5]
MIHPYIYGLMLEHYMRMDFYARMRYANYLNSLNEHTNYLDAMKIDPWNSNIVYWGGEQVTYNGKVYEAKWWTRGDVPDKPVANPWETPWKLVSGGTEPSPTPQPTPEPTPIPTPIPTPEEPPTQNIPNVYPDYSNVDVGKGIKWPSKCFAPFVDATGWPPLKFADMANTLSVPYFNLGFVVSESSNLCKASWGTYYAGEAGPLNDQIKSIRAMGGDVIVSFGGAANTPLHVTAPDVNTLKEQYKRFIKAYGLTRIDFDIEGAWLNDKNSLVRNSKAIKLLQDELKNENYMLQVWYTLPVLPSGLTADGINSLRYLLAEKVNLDGVNVMTMDYGDSVAPNPQGRMAQYGIDAITNLHAQLKSVHNEYGISKSDSELWSMIGTTPMIGMNDVTTEIFTINDANKTVAFAKQKSIGMISMWSLNRDKQCPGGETKYVSITCSSILQKDYEFSSTFNKYNDLSNFKPGSGPTPPSPGEGGIPNWSSTAVYVGGDRVKYEGKTYEAKWWNQGSNPTKEVANPWETPWKLIG